MASGNNVDSAPTVTALADGFTVTSVDFRWSVMSHTCGAEVRFVNPTRDRVDWYRRIHRCHGRDWQGQ